MKRQMMFMAAMLLLFGLEYTSAQQPDQQKHEVTVDWVVDSTGTGSPGILTYATRTADGVNPVMVLTAGESDGKQVSGGPYSAESVSETIQTLADGNRIIQRSTSKIYRDSEGRTRRESEGSGLPAGPLFFQSVGSAEGSVYVRSNGGSGGNNRVVIAPAPSVITSAPGASSAQIVITDPVAGLRYFLDPDKRTAQKMVMPVIVSIGLDRSTPADVAAAVEKARREMAATGRGSVVIEEPGKTVVVQMKKPEGSSGEAPVTESLGTRTIEGVECEGTRTTVTIPAGQIGNEQPIVITSERWYSHKLQTEVLSTRHDPRMGDTTFKLVNLSQAEPPASLFQVPPDYTVTVMGGQIQPRTVLQPRVNKKK